MAFTTLAHHIDVDLLRAAVESVRDGGATGVEGTTATDYACELGANLSRLVDRLKAGTYRASPVRRVHIPKCDGRKTQPIGIPTYEDNVLQKAVTMVLKRIYEQDLLLCSFGFRPRRSAHHALDALWSGLTAMRGGWVLEADIQSFLDTLDQVHLRRFLDQRARDGGLRRVSDKWLTTGVIEGGKISREREDDARRVFDVLPKRFGKYGLTLHPTKTRMVRPITLAFTIPISTGPGSVWLAARGRRSLGVRGRSGYQRVETYDRSLPLPLG